MKGLSLKVHMLLIAALGLLFLFQFLKVQQFDADSDQRMHLHFERLGHLDAQSEQAMLQIYSRTLFDYDQLSRDIDEMDRVMSAIEAEIGHGERFAEAVAALRHSVALQSEGADAFKANYAIYTNSLRYIPTLIEQLQGEHPKLHHWLTQLDRDLYHWKLYPGDHESQKRVQQAMADAGGHGLRELERHMRVVLDYADPVLDALDKVINCGTAENAALVSNLFDRHFVDELAENRRSQMLLPILGIAVLLYLLLLLFSRQKTLRQLKVSEQRIQMLFDLIPDGVAIHRDGKWTYCNPAFIDKYGAGDAAQLIGSDVLERVHPEYRDQVRERIRKELDEMTAAPLMLQKHLRLDGSIFYCEVQGIPFVDAGETSVMLVVRDVTDRIVAQQEAEKSRMNLQTVIDNSNALVFQKDRQGIYLLANRYFAELLDRNVDEVIGCRDLHLFAPEVAKAYTDHDAEVLASACSMEFKESMMLADGEHHFISIRVPILDEDGEVESIFGISSDVTELIQAERERAEAQSKIEHVQRLESLGVLAGGIAHDFNNILTAIMGNAAMAERSLSSTAPAREYLSRIEGSSQRAADLCRQMLAYSGKGKFVIKAVNVTDLVREMARLMEVSINKHVVIEYYLEENLPAIEADAAQIQQVILNLITNANEAIEDDGIITFTTGIMHADRSYLDSIYTEEALPEGEYVYLEVADTGKGMDRETMEKIFDPFFTTKFTGRGLGMSAVLGIVRGHNGALKIDSQPGAGSRFRVLIPPTELAVEADTSEPADIDPPVEGGAILIVDDEATIREVAAMMLQEMGFDTFAAEDGEEGVALYQQHQERIVGVILDMTMPRMDGESCFKKLRSIDPEVKVLLSSGYSEQDAMSRFIGKGLAGFVQKPYLPDDLQQKVRMMLNQRTRLSDD